MKIKLLFLCLLLPFCAWAQGEGDVWFFGDSVLMDFASGAPVVTTNTDMVSRESSSSVSDRNGNLLLYSNCGQVYNANHQMINGWPPAAFYPGGDRYAQGMLLLPISDSTFFHFNKWGSSTFLGSSTLYFSKINTLSNGGGGGVYDPHQFLSDSLAEHCAAVRHADGKNWWVLDHKTESDSFVVFRTDSAGNVFKHFQKVGGVHAALWSDYTSPLVFNEQGDQFALTSDTGRVEIFDFDRCTGEITFFDVIQKPKIQNNAFYGLSFSPSGQFLYVSDRAFDFSGLPSYLYQFDLNSSNILASELLIWQTPAGFYPNGDPIRRTLFTHKLGPDGKIYIVHASGDIPGRPVGDSLGVIHAPDALGLACDFRPKSFPVTPGRAAGLPNIPNYRLGPLVAQVAEAGSADTICLGSAAQLGVPDTSGNLVFDWVPAAGLDDPTAAQPLASPGVTTTYYLMVTDTTVHASCGTTEDSVTVFVVDTVGAPIAYAGEDSILCQGDSIQIGSPPVAGDFYTWTPSSGVSDVSLSATVAFPNASTWYVLTAFDSTYGQVYTCRTAIDSVFLEVELPLQHPFPEGQRFCPGEELTVGVQAEAGFSYAWNPVSGLQDAFVSRTQVAPDESIVYTLIITDENKVTENCRNRLDPVILSADDCLLQNVLSPNGDGINDVLDLGDFNEPIGLSVYDRWGSLIFSADGYQNDWSGTNLPASTYYYRIHVRAERGGDKVGFFDLVR